MRLPRIGPEAFDGVQLRRGGRVAVAFLADWCPFCRAFEPEFARLRGEGIELAVADLTSEESPLWDPFRVAVVPTVVVFDAGTAIFRADGVPGQGLGRADLRAVALAARAATVPNRAPSRPP